MKLSRSVFYVLVALLPLNLGKHFEVYDSYVWGILSDYLVPTVYLQDLLIIVLLVLWVKEKGFPTTGQIGVFLNIRLVRALIFFLFSLFLSTLISERFIPSLFIFIRALLYALLAFYISLELSVEKDFFNVIKIISYSVIFLSVLSAAQFLKQGSLFNNYLILGEQPYSYSTWGVLKENVLGKSVIPSYGLFRHPNIFGGFLSVLLLWLFPYLKRNTLHKVAFFSGILSLLLTFSYVAWGSTLLGLVLGSYINNHTLKKEAKRKAVMLTLGLVLVVTLILPLAATSQNPSLSRRGRFFNISVETAKENFLYGVGPGNFVSVLGDISFNQPVHNIFLLILAESGIFAFVFFIVILFLTIRDSVSPLHFSVFLISLLQIIFVGSLDHYFWTIHQTLLLLWIVLGFSFQDNFSKMHLS